MPAFRALLGAVLISYLAALPAPRLWAQLIIQNGIGYGSISGELESNRPLDEKIVIVIKSATGVTVREVFTDSWGKFVSPALPLGVYTVEVRSPDYRGEPQQVTLTDHMPTADVRIALKYYQQPRATTSPASPTVNLTQLSAMPAAALKEFDVAVKETHAGKLADAAGHYEKALKRSPNFYAAEVNYADVLVKEGQAQSAVSHLRHAIAVDPTPSYAYLILGRISFANRQLSEAETELASAVQRPPATADAALLYGATEYQLGKIAQAEKALLTARQLDPHNGQVLLQLYNVYRVQNRIPDARSALKQFIAEHPRDPHVERARSALKELSATQLGR